MGQIFSLPAIVVYSLVAKCWLLATMEGNERASLRSQRAAFVSLAMATWQQSAERIVEERKEEERSERERRARGGKSRIGKRPLSLARSLPPNADALERSRKAYIEPAAHKAKYCRSRKKHTTHIYYTKYKNVLQ